MCNNNSDCSCISNILKVINILQKKAVHHEEVEECEDICDRRTLGRRACCSNECNTRPIQLFLSCSNGNNPLVMPTTKGPITPDTVFSSVFRVERVDECCCTCRVLVEEHSSVPVTDPCEIVYLPTNSFFTIDLKCVCAVKCLEDTFVDCL